MDFRKIARIAIISIIISVCAGCGENASQSTPSAQPAVTGTPTVTPTAQPTSTPTDTPTPTNTSTPTPSPTTGITIGMVGDVLLHDRIEEDCKQEDGTYDYHSIFAHTKDMIQGFDLALVNQEVIIGGSKAEGGSGISAYPTFNAAFTLADALTSAGFDVALHATNHALDKGKKGLVNCLNNWKNYPDMKVMGIYGSQEEADHQIYYYEKDGVKIAFLNFTYSTNGISVPSDMKYCVGPMLTTANKDKIGALLDEADENADFTVVCPHWGTEYTIKETKEQKTWNTFFYEHGVDLVLGTHPHVIEPIAITDSTGTRNLSEYPAEDGHRTVEKGTMLTFYSIGNFVNWTGESGSKIYQRMLGGMAGVTLSVDEEGDVFILDFDITPVVSHVVTGHNQVTVYRFSEYTEELARANEIKKQTDNFSINSLTKLCDDVWGKLWRE